MIKKRCLKLKLPQTKQKRFELYVDYIDKLEKVLPEIKVLSFDPGICYAWYEKYNSGGEVIKERLGVGTEVMSLYMVHLILKAYNLHNKDIEYYE